MVIIMDSKGFTLIEMIVVVALLATLSVTIGISISGMMDRQEEKEYASYVETLESAACVYAETNDITTTTSVTTAELIEAGLIRTTLTNPKTDVAVSEDDTTIEITWSNNEKKCTYKD